MRYNLQDVSSSLSLDNLTNKELLVALGTVIASRDRGDNLFVIPTIQESEQAYDSETFETILNSRNIYCDGIKSYVRCTVDNKIALIDMQEEEALGHHIN